MNCDKFIEANAGVEFNIHLVTKTLTYYISGKVEVIVSYLSRHACLLDLQWYVYLVALVANLQRTTVWIKFVCSKLFFRLKSCIDNVLI